MSTIVTVNGSDVEPARLVVIAQPGEIVPAIPGYALLSSWTDGTGHTTYRLRASKVPEGRPALDELRSQADQVRAAVTYADDSGTHSDAERASDMREEFRTSVLDAIASGALTQPEARAAAELAR